MAQAAVDQLALELGRGTGEAEWLAQLLVELVRRVDVDVDADQQGREEQRHAPVPPALVVRGRLDDEQIEVDLRRSIDRDVRPLPLTYWTKLTPSTSSIVKKQRASSTTSS